VYLLCFKLGLRVSFYAAPYGTQAVALKSHWLLKIPSGYHSEILHSALRVPFCVLHGYKNK